MTADGSVKSPMGDDEVVTNWRAASDALKSFGEAAQNAAVAMTEYAERWRQDLAEMIELDVALDPRCDRAITVVEDVIQRTTWGWLDLWPQRFRIVDLLDSGLDEPTITERALLRDAQFKALGVTPHASELFRWDA